MKPLTTSLIALAVLFGSSLAQAREPRHAPAVAAHVPSLAVRAASSTYRHTLEARVTAALLGAVPRAASPAPRSNVARRIDAAQLALEGREPLDGDGLMPIGPEALASAMKLPN